MTVVDIQRLRRIYEPRGRKEPVVALDSLDLAIEDGEVHGLLGPNGAGKTTLVKILSTVLLPTSGTARVLGYDVAVDADEVRQRIGLVFGGDRGLYSRLTARQNLDYWAALYGVSGRRAAAAVGALLDRVGLRDRADDRVEGFSRGMKQRLHLARGLVGDPSVLFLDEPTVGLDPMAARDFRNLVEELRAAGTTILLTTHDMAEAEALCDRVTLIDRGAVIATEEPSALGRLLSRYEWVEIRDLDPALANDLAALRGVAAVEARPYGWTRFQPDTENVVGQILERALAAGITAVRTGQPSLEDVYLHVISDRGMRT